MKRWLLIWLGLGAVGCVGREPVAVAVDLSASTRGGCHQRFETFREVIGRIRLARPFAPIDVYRIEPPQVTPRRLGRIPPLSSGEAEFIGGPSEKGRRLLKKHWMAIQPRIDTIWKVLTSEACTDCSGLLATIFWLLPKYAFVVVLTDGKFEDYIDPTALRERLQKFPRVVYVVGDAPRRLHTWPSGVWERWVHQWKDSLITDPYALAADRIQEAWEKLFGHFVRFHWGCDMEGLP